MKKRLTFSTKFCILLVGGFSRTGSPLFEKEKLPQKSFPTSSPDEPFCMISISVLLFILGRLAGKTVIPFAIEEITVGRVRFLTLVKI